MFDLCHLAVINLNLIDGHDNLDMLRTLWERIQGIEEKVYSGLDKKALEQMKQTTVPPIDARLEFDQMTALFLGDELPYFISILDKLLERGLISGEVVVESRDSYVGIVDAIKKVSDKTKVRNFATIFLLMAKYAINYLDSIENEQGELRAK